MGVTEISFFVCECVCLCDDHLLSLLCIDSCFEESLCLWVFFFFFLFSGLIFEDRRIDRLIDLLVGLQDLVSGNLWDFGLRFLGFLQNLSCGVFSSCPGFSKLCVF